GSTEPGRAERVASAAPEPAGGRGAGDPPPHGPAGVVRRPRPAQVRPPASRPAGSGAWRGHPDRGSFPAGPHHLLGRVPHRRVPGLGDPRYLRVAVDLARDRQHRAAPVADRRPVSASPTGGHQTVARARRRPQPAAAAVGALAAEPVPPPAQDL
ncbi:MAG: hypothetical protein AVDCRST_MAG73-607, partial [uncultured Thermomicrobiales bacterium]